MAGVNKVILVGNLGKDPEVRHLESGAVVANFPLATSDSYKDRKTGERITQTEWHNIVIWRGLAEVAEKYLKKGSSVYVEGSLRTRSWDDQNGQKKYKTEILAQSIQFLDKIGGGASQGGGGFNDSFGEPPANDGGGFGSNDGFNQAAPQQAPQGGGFSAPAQQSAPAAPAARHQLFDLVCRPPPAGSFSSQALSRASWACFQ